MATVINNPRTGGADTDSGAGLIIGAIIAVALVALLIVYAIPAIRDSVTPAPSTTQINVPTPTVTTPQ